MYYKLSLQKDVNKNLEFYHKNSPLFKKLLLPISYLDH